MKYIYLSVLLVTLSCGGVKKDATKKNTIEKATIIETKKEIPKAKVITIEDKAIILELKNPNSLNDAKALVKNSGLKWTKMAFENNANAIALINVPGDKVPFWTENLTKSNEFKSVSPYNKTTLDALIKKAKTSFFTFRKTECFGDCPVYNVTIDALGNVSYTGLKYVTASGNRSFKLTDKQFTLLKKKLANNNFSEYKKLYDNPNIMDLPSTFITHKDEQVQIRLWKGIPKNLVDVHEYVQGILLDKNFFE